MSESPRLVVARHPFARIITRPDAGRLALGGLIGRFREAGTGLAIVLAVRAIEHSYAIAGIASATYLIAAAVTRPAHGRLVDRTSASAGLIGSSLLSSLALLAMAAAVWQRAGELVLLAAAAAIGVTLPALSATLRALWPTVAPDAIDGAYAFDTLLYEISLIASPALVGIIATAAAPAIALIVLAVLGTLGTIAVARAPAARRDRSSQGVQDNRDGLFSSVVVRLILISLLVGFAEGSMTVLAPAFATRHHAASLSGLLLSAFSVGSLLGALMYGPLAARTSWRTRLAICTAALTLALAGLAVGAVDPLAFGILIGIVGVALAPTLATGFIAIRDAAPAGSLTEAFTWASFCASAGAAGAQAISGELINGPGVSTGLWLPFGAAAVSLGVSGALLGRRHA